MNKSESIGNLAAALAKAQKAIKGALRDAQNPHFKHLYADLASIWEACREALAENELAVTQLPSADGAVVKLETILMHSSGEYISGELAVTARDGSPQSVGSAITYLRRYGLASIVGVAPTGEDDDAETSQGRQRPRNAKPGAPPAAEADPRLRVAEVLARSRRVARTEAGFKVVDPKTGDVFQVTRNSENLTVCGCDEFVQNFERGEGAVCLHILAVKAYCKIEKAASS